MVIRLFSDQNRFKPSPLNLVWKPCLIRPPQGWWKLQMTLRLHFRHLIISSHNILVASPVCGPNKWFLFLFFHITLEEVLGKLCKGDNITDKKEDTWTIHLLGTPEKTGCKCSQGLCSRDWQVLLVLRLHKYLTCHWSRCCSSLLPDLNSISQQSGLWVGYKAHITDPKELFLKSKNVPLKRPKPSKMISFNFSHLCI